MKPILAIAAISLAGCSIVASRPEVSLSGTLANWLYQDPSGETMQSAVIELDRPIVVVGLAESVSRVELRLSERHFMNWEHMAGRHASISCHLSIETLWGYSHASCAPGSIRFAS